MNADLVLFNGNVITMNPSDQRAQAVAVKKGKIVHVGTNSKIKQWIGGHTKTIDLKHKTVVPGLNDSHAHMISLGHPFPYLDLRHVSSIKEIQRRLKMKVNEIGKEKWILGRGWDQDRLKEKRYPTRWDLDKVSPDNPVLLTRVCGHVSVANSRALETAKIDTNEASSLGDLVDRDPKTGEPTGLLREGASDLVCNLPELSKKEMLAACSRACGEAVKLGLTSVTWLASKPNEIHALMKLEKRAKLPLRINIMVPIEHFESFKSKRLNKPFLKLRCVKIFTDGSLGARTAALEKPYADDSSTKGVLYYNQEDLQKLFSEADKAGFQIAVHAIGDRALSETLKAFKNAVGKKQIAQKRHRIEHASVVNQTLLKQIKKLGLLVCVQPPFVISDFWIENRLGHDRARWTYAFKSMITGGICIAGSSDAPCELLDPVLGLWAAVVRESVPEERLSVNEVLEAYTVGAAYFSFEEGVKGSIAVGKYADLTVLSHDPFKVEPEKIKDIQVEMTIVDGKAVFSARG